jgi:hypothetical protein
MICCYGQRQSLGFTAQYAKPAAGTLPIAPPFHHFKKIATHASLHSTG